MRSWHTPTAHCCQWWLLASFVLTASGCARQPPPRTHSNPRDDAASQLDVAPSSLEWEHTFSTPGGRFGVLTLPDSSGGVVVVARIKGMQTLEPLDGIGLQAMAFDSLGRTRFVVPYAPVPNRRSREATAACLDDDGTLVIAGANSVVTEDSLHSHQALFVERYDTLGRLLTRKEYSARYSQALTVFPMGNHRTGLVLIVNAEVRIGAQVLAAPTATARTIPQNGTLFWVVLDHRGEMLFWRNLGDDPLWVVPDGAGVAFVRSRAGQQGVHPWCLTSGWHAESWSFQGNRLWQRDLETPLRFVLPRAKGGFFAATLSCSDPCPTVNASPSCPDARPVLLTINRRGLVAERRPLDDSLRERLDVVLEGVGSQARTERLFPDGSILHQSGVSELAPDGAHWPKAFGARGALYPSIEDTVLVIHHGGSPETIEVARRQLPKKPAVDRHASQ